tara:strand:- start:49 stop:963 length:915 start_codon:yes stop_codon:yes gene_type:complete
MNLNTGVLMVGVWTHVAIVIKNDSLNTIASLYLNGNKLPNTISEPLGTKFFPPSSASQVFKFGAGFNNTSVKGQFDSMQIADGTALTDSQVAAVADQSDRLMTMETAAAISPYIEQRATMFGDATYTNCTLSLDGVGDYATVSSGFRYTDFLSISLWFKTSSGGDQRIIASHVRAAGNNGFFIRLEGGSLRFRHPSGGNTEIAGPNGLNDGAWHHLVLTWEVSVGYVLYVDDVSVKTGAAGVADGYLTDWPLVIGANPYDRTGDPLVDLPYGFFNGEIAKVEVLNEVLDAAEVTTRFNDGNGAC